MKQQYTLLIGLTTKDFLKIFSEQEALNIISVEFIKAGILGFNSELIKGFWNGKQEDSLKVSFINTFEIQETNFLKTIETIRERLQQEAVLFQKQEIDFSFI